MKFKTYTREDYHKLSNESFERKINIALTRIQEIVVKTEGRCVCSFSGGKDSSVLLDLCRRVMPEMKAVYINTQVEHKQIESFARSVNNLIEIRPYYCKNKNYKGEVKHKNCSDCEGCFYWISVEKGFVYPNKRVVALLGEKSHKAAKTISGNYKASLEEYKNLMQHGLKFSDNCCNILKKDVAKKWSEQNGIEMQIIGTRANESLNRYVAWTNNGCTAWHLGHGNPLSIWKEQDVMRYLYEFDIPYCKDYYGEIVEFDGAKGRYSAYGFDSNKCLKFSKRQRSGCCGCPIAFNSESGRAEIEDLRVNFPVEYAKRAKIPGWEFLLEYVKAGRKYYKDPDEPQIEQLSLLED